MADANEDGLPISARRVVFATGVFDLFHIGHLQFLEQARSLGDRLIVGVQDDEWVIESKGQAPIYSLWHRLRLVSALSCVDVAFPIHGPEDEIGVVLCGATVRAISTDHGYLPRHHILREKLEAAGVEYVVIPRTPNISATEIREQCYEQMAHDRDLSSHPAGCRNWDASG
jgi:glycerol-3-phosphate cytidylyltransferase